MKKKILLALLIVVILLGAWGAYAYFATDALKTDKKLFFSYILKNNMFSDFEDEKLTKYIEKQEDTAYTNKGEISVKVEGNNNLGIAETSVEMLNKSKITFEGKTDNSKKMTEQEITADFSQGFNIPVKYKRDGDIFGIQSNFLDSKFIAIRNENLKALLEKFNMDSEEIPDKIEISKEQFTQEEVKALQKKYIGILSENLEDELFSKEKVDKQTVVTLKMTETKCVDIIIKILETARNDEILLNKMSETYQKEEFQQQIDDAIEELKEVETSEINVVELKMYIEAKTIRKLEISMIEDNTTVMFAVIENNTNQIIMKVYEEETLIGDFSIIKEITGNDLTYTMNIKIDPEEENTNVSIKIQYKNLLELDNVEENYEVKLSYESPSESTSFEKETTEININYKDLKTFSSNVEIEGLNANNATILNDATDTEIQNLLVTIYQNLGLM